VHITSRDGARTRVGARSHKWDEVARLCLAGRGTPVVGVRKLRTTCRAL